MTYLKKKKNIFLNAFEKIYVCETHRLIYAIDLMTYNGGFRTLQALRYGQMKLLNNEPFFICTYHVHNHMVRTNICYQLLLLLLLIFFFHHIMCLIVLSILAFRNVHSRPSKHLDNNYHRQLTSIYISCTTMER